ncbi:FAD-linked sulfhydryl oxidase ALR [Myxozyma melibiosi]|uniref:Sulfhydryl oxidase n=1 Tax=Myxozyma melibiosi TaxID=54550 RepID=A0ABR1FF13_9ASCO
MAKVVIRRPALVLALVLASIIVFALTISPAAAPGSSAASFSSSGITEEAHPRRPVIQKASSSLSRGSGVSYTIADASDYDPLKGPVPVASQKLSQGGPIMPHLGNETIKAELGRASWKLLHTILARYPEKPTSEEREALSAYIYLFSRVYPCGECAAHFQKLLKQFPPQTSSRVAASQWGCHVHNQVNARLGKDIFDCNDIAEKYKCGCEDGEEPAADEEKDAEKEKRNLRIAEKDLTAEFLQVEERLRE